MSLKKGTGWGAAKKRSKKNLDPADPDREPKVKTVRKRTPLEKIATKGMKLRSVAQGVEDLVSRELAKVRRKAEITQIKADYNAKMAARKEARNARDRARRAAAKTPITPTAIVKDSKPVQPSKKRQAKVAQTEPAPLELTPPEPKAETKMALIFALMSRPQGATLTEIMDTAGWQRHTCRGWIATQKGKGHPITTTKEPGSKNRRYLIER